MQCDARTSRRGAPRLASGLLSAVLLVVGVVATVDLRAGAASNSGTPPPNAFILVDARTGAVITARHMHAALPPASTAKIMTALVAIERLPPNATIAVSQNAANRESMRIGMHPGTRWPLADAMASMMMVSANDAAYAVAETVGGSISGFAADLNSTARRYGMRDSTFGDPAGLTDTTSFNGGPHVSAYDLAIATRNALTVPAIAKWAETKTYSFIDSSGTHHDLTNHDKFLPDNGFGYVGANGFKTGFTQIADHTLVATAKRNGRQCIAVILGSVDSGYTWAASLLDKCWVKPAGATTGVFLPRVAVSPYAARASARAGFAKIALGPSGAALAASASAHGSTSPAAASAHGSPRPAVVSPLRSAHLASAGNTAAAPPTGKKASAHKGGGLLTPTRFLFLLVLALAVAFVLRRRAVKRQRTRRIARQRARAKAMRSGSLPVVDGRYRTGTRVGPPLESDVHIERTLIDLTHEDPPVRRSRASRPRTPE